MNLNNKIQRFLEIKEQMKSLETELKVIENDLKAAGSVETDMFSVTVSEQSREFLKGIKDVASVFGREALDSNGLIGVTTYQVVRAKALAGEKKEAA